MTKGQKTLFFEAKKAGQKSMGLVPLGEEKQQKWGKNEENQKKKRGGKG